MANWTECPPTPATAWAARCNAAEAAPAPEPEPLTSWAWYELEEGSAEAAPLKLSDSSGNSRRGDPYGGIQAFGEAGPELGDLGVRVAPTGTGANVEGGKLNMGAGGNVTDPNNPPEGYIAPTIHTNFTIGFRAIPTAIQSVPTKLSEPAGTGYVVSSLTDNNFLHYPQHGNRGNANTTTDIHAGVGTSLGTNCILIAEHTHSHTPVRAVYEADLSGWHQYHIVFRGDPKTVGSARIYIDGVFAGGLAGTYREGPSVKSRPFIAQPLLTFDPAAAWLRGFAGTIADFAIWDYALSDADIAANIR